MKSFKYEARVEWTGNDGTGTSSPRYGRHNEVSAPGRPTIVGSAPSEFGGDGENWTPEEFLVAAVSQCHMLTYLYLCSRAGIVVDSYLDIATGTLVIDGSSGSFTSIELRPTVVIVSGDEDTARALHDDAHRGCYIAGSVKSAVSVEPVISRRTRRNDT